MDARNTKKLVLGYLHEFVAPVEGSKHQEIHDISHERGSAEEQVRYLSVVFQQSMPKRDVIHSLGAHFQGYTLAHDVEGHVPEERDLHIGLDIFGSTRAAAAVFSFPAATDGIL